MKLNQRVCYRGCDFLVTDIKDKHTVLLVPTAKGMRGKEPIEAPIDKVYCKSR